MGISYGLAMLLVFLALLLFSALRILREYERGVVFQLGRFWKVKGPGLVLVIPAIQQMVRIDLRTIVLDVPPQDVISRDNVSVKVNAVVYFRVLDPQKAIIQVENYLAATSQLAQTTLRAVLGKHELDEMLAERERLNLDIQQVLDAQTDAWGIKVANVEIKHVDLNESMVRAIARQAEAERERRAKVIHAEGELQASEKLMQAAQMLGRQSGAMQLRYMQTLARSPATRVRPSSSRCRSNSSAASTQVPRRETKRPPERTRRGESARFVMEISSSRDTGTCVPGVGMAMLWRSTPGTLLHAAMRTPAADIAPPLRAACRQPAPGRRLLAAFRRFAPAWQRPGGGTGDHRAQARRLRLELPAGTLVACPARRAQR